MENGIEYICEDCGKVITESESDMFNGLCEDCMEDATMEIYHRAAESVDRINAIYYVFKA